MEILWPIGAATVLWLVHMAGGMPALVVAAAAMALLFKVLGDRRARR